MDYSFEDSHAWFPKSHSLWQGRVLFLITKQETRCERGHIPDTETYLTLINVIGVPSEFFETDK